MAEKEKEKEKGAANGLWPENDYMNSLHCNAPLKRGNRKAMAFFEVEKWRVSVLFFCYPQGLLISCSSGFRTSLVRLN